MNHEIHQLGLLHGLVGKKVSLSTTDFHYAIGRFVQLRSDGRLSLLVGSQEILIDRTGVARIREADQALAEYIK